MKKFFTVAIVLVVLSSCEIVVIEPSYDFRDDIVGLWEMDEYSETYNIKEYYDVRISKSLSNFDELYIHNFYNINVSVLAYLDNRKIIIPLQVIDGYEIEGVGTIRSDHIDFTYAVFDTIDGGWTDYCNSVAW